MFSTSESWIILNTIEKSIKTKIEAIGKPLQEWDVSIYRGILTGYNEAFIIDGDKRNKLIKEDPKSGDIIRPILRGRDIKRYGYQYADLFVIATFPALHIDIEKYPAIKNHLLSFGMERLEQTGKAHKIKGEIIQARKKTTNKWFETSDTIAYWEDFSKPKLLWAETMRIRKNVVERFPRFAYTEASLYTDKTCFFASGKNLKSILAVLNSSIGRYQCSLTVSMLDDGGYLMQKIYIEQLKICNLSMSENSKICELVDKITSGNFQNSNVENYEQELDAFIMKIYRLTPKEIAYLQNLFSRPLARNT